MSRLRHLGWNQCFHGLTSGTLESCHRQCLQSVCAGFGLSSGCGDGAFGWNTEAPSLHPAFYQKTKIPPGFYLGLVGVVGLVKGVSLPLLISWIVVATLVKRVRLTRKTRPGIPVLSHRDPGLVGHPTPRRWNILLFLDPLDQEKRWACLAIFFLGLGVGRGLRRESLDPASEGNRLRGFRLVSPAEGTGALAPVHLN